MRDKSLWPNFEEYDMSATHGPVDIFEQQSEFLLKKTNELVYAEVQSERRTDLGEEIEDGGDIGTGGIEGPLLTGSPKKTLLPFLPGMQTNIPEEVFRYKFLFKSKYIPNYSFHILSFSHPIQLYPVHLKVDRELLKELKINKALIAKDEDQLYDLLGPILQSKRVTDIIMTMKKIALQNKESNEWNEQ